MSRFLLHTFLFSYYCFVLSSSSFHIFCIFNFCCRHVTLRYVTLRYFTLCHVVIDSFSKHNILYQKQHNFEKKCVLLVYCTRSNHKNGTNQLLFIFVFVSVFVFVFVFIFIFKCRKIWHT